MEKTTLKIHIERDFSFAEFEVDYDPYTGEGLPLPAVLTQIWNRLPTKVAESTPARGNTQRNSRQEPLATANQRRLLEHLGAWEDGITKSEASKILREMGY